MIWLHDFIGDLWNNTAKKKHKIKHNLHNPVLSFSLNIFAPRNIENIATPKSY